MYESHVYHIIVNTFVSRIQSKFYFGGQSYVYSVRLWQGGQGGGVWELRGYAPFCVHEANSVHNYK